MTGAALGISLLTLGVLAATLFYTRLRPFTPKFAFGQPALGHGDFPASHGVERLVQVILPCEIHNIGAKSGVIEDIALCLSSERLGGEIYFFPNTFVKPKYIIEGKVKPEVIQPWSSTLIPPHSNVNHTIWFLNMHPYHGPNTLVQGVHRYVIKYRKLGKDDWITAYDDSLTLDEMGMKQIMAQVGNLHLADTGTMEARDRLVRHLMEADNARTIQQG